MARDNTLDSSRELRLRRWRNSSVVSEDQASVRLRAGSWPGCWMESIGPTRGGRSAISDRPAVESATGETANVVYLFCCFFSWHISGPSCV